LFIQLYFAIAVACGPYFTFGVGRDFNVSKSDPIFRPPWTELHAHIAMWTNNNKCHTTICSY